MNSIITAKGNCVSAEKTDMSPIPDFSEIHQKEHSLSSEPKQKKRLSSKRRISYYEVPPRTIGERIRWERQKLGLTQKQLSKKLGISPSYLGALERGSRPVSASISSRIHHFLNISYDYLLEGQGLPPSMLPQIARETGPGSLYDEMEHILKTCTQEELEACCSLIKTHLMSMRRQQYALHRDGRSATKNSTPERKTAKRSETH